MASTQFSGKHEFYPARGAGALGADRKAATALVFQAVVAGVASTVAIQGDTGALIAIQASALNTDDVIFNAALVFVNALGGGLTYFEVGNYNTSDPIDFPGNNLELVGTGRGSFINGDLLANNENAIEITGRTDCVIRNFSVQTNNGGGLTIHCIFIEDGSDRFRVENIWIIDSDEDGIHIEGTTIDGGSIKDCEILDTDGDGISVDMDGGNFMDYIHIEGTISLSAGANGFLLTDLRRGEVNGNIITGSTNDGIVLNVSIDSLLDGNNCYLNGNHGISLVNSDFSVISNNICRENDSGDTAAFDGINIDANSIENIVSSNQCYGNHRYGILCAGRNVIIGNVSNSNDRHGIVITTNWLIEIIGNYCINNGVDAAGTYHGILVEGTSNLTTIVGNWTGGGGAIQEDGIHLADGALTALISNNFCYNGMGSGIALTANNNDCHLTNNYCNLNDDYGIEITAVTCNNNLVKNNFLVGNITGPFLDNGTNTRLATYSMPFIQGTTLISAAGNPWGWEIDLAGEFAVTWGWLPLEVQQVVRIRVVAVGLAAPGAGNAMRLELTGEGATFDEVYTTNSIDVANHDSNETNFAINDVIQWIFTATDDPQIGTLLGGDRVQFEVLHEVAGNGNIATDAVFSSVEIEYV